MTYGVSDPASTDSVILNLALTARVSNARIAMYLRKLLKRSARLSQGFHTENPWKPNTTDLDMKIKDAFKVFLNGYIRNSERDYKIIIPRDIVSLLSSCFEVGAADFYDTLDPHSVKCIIWCKVSEIWFRDGTEKDSDSDEEDEIYRRIV